MVKVSVIVPVYNVEKYLRKCIDSIVNQTLEDIEIICINDGSTDSSLDILQSYAKNDTRIKVISQENNGLGFARNVGLKHATGDYIYFMDSDDYIELNALELAYNNIVSNSADMLIFKYIFCRTDSRFTVERFEIDKLFPDVDFNNFTVNYESIKNQVLFGSSPPWNKLFKRDFLNEYEDLVFPVGIAYEDLIFHVKTLLRASKISILPEYLYYYKKDNSSSISNNAKNHMEIYKNIDMIKEFLIEEGFMEEFKLHFDTLKIEQIMYHLTPPFNEEFYLKATEEIKCIERFDRDLVEKKNYEKYILFNSTNSLNDFIKCYYQNEIIRLNNWINDLNKENNHLNKENKKLKEILNNLNNENENLNSNSRKLTKPLRSTLNFFKR